MSCTGSADWLRRLWYSLVKPVCVSVTRRVKSTSVVAAKKTQKPGLAVKPQASSTLTRISALSGLKNQMVAELPPGWGTTVPRPVRPLGAR